MLKNYYILRSADMCSIASVVCKLLRSGTFGACIDLSVRSDKAVRGRILEIGYELLVSLIGYQAQLKRTHEVLDSYSMSKRSPVWFL